MKAHLSIGDDSETVALRQFSRELTGSDGEVNHLLNQLQIVGPVDQLTFKAASRDDCCCTFMIRLRSSQMKEVFTTAETDSESPDKVIQKAVDAYLAGD